MVLHLPWQCLLYRLCSLRVTHHSSKLNLIGPKLQLSVYKQHLCLCLSLSHLLYSFFPLCPYESSLPLSVSLSLSLLFFACYILVAIFVTAIQTQENPLNVQPNSWKMRIQLLYTRKSQCSQTVKCSYAKMSLNVSYLYFCTGQLCTGCNRKHSSFAFLSTEVKGRKGFAGGYMTIFIAHSSAISLYLDVVMVTFKCLFGRNVNRMEHEWSMMTLTVILYR